jgi:hypothetical protein
MDSQEIEHYTQILEEVSLFRQMLDNFQSASLNIEELPRWFFGRWMTLSLPRIGCEMLASLGRVLWLVLDVVWLSVWFVLGLRSVVYLVGVGFMNGCQSGSLSIDCLSIWFFGS